jgi:hypothetical protein
MYQKIIDPTTGKEAQCIKRIADNGFLPFDQANTDFREYQNWLAEGNEPLPADILEINVE